MMGLQTKMAIPGIPASSVVIFANPSHYLCSNVDTSQTLCVYGPHWGLYGSTCLSSFLPLVTHFSNCTYNDAAIIQIYSLHSGCELQDNQSWCCRKLSHSALVRAYVPIALVLINIQRGYITAQPTPRPLHAWQESKPSGCGEWEGRLK